MLATNVIIYEVFLLLLVQHKTCLVFPLRRDAFRSILSSYLEMTKVHKKENTSFFLYQWQGKSKWNQQSPSPVFSTWVTRSHLDWKTLHTLAKLTLQNIRVSQTWVLQGHTFTAPSKEQRAPWSHISPAASNFRLNWLKCRANWQYAEISKHTETVAVRSPAETNRTQQLFWSGTFES